MPQLKYQHVVSTYVKCKINILFSIFYDYSRESDRESKEYYDSDDDEASYFHDDDGGGDIIGEDRAILGGGFRRKTKTTTVRPTHRRHLHKHPYDRGPTIRDTSN